MCVFLRSMCLKKKFRDDFERLLCWLDHWLSCMLDCIHVCIFHSWKTGFKKWLDTSSIPPRHLAICRASQAFSYYNLDSSSIPYYLLSFLSLFLNAISWINRESSCLLDSFSTLGGSIELLFLKLILCCSILARYLNCWRPLSWHLPRQLPQHLLIPQLSSITEGPI